MITSWVFWAVLFGTVGVYWCLPRGKEWFLAASSLAYLLFLDRLAAGLVLGWSAAFYWATQKRKGGVRGSRWLAFALIAGVLLCLGYFKYVPAIARAVSSAPTDDDVAPILVPFGISYFTFKLIAYMLDAVRGVLPANTPRQFLVYMLFFPIFGAGPIERFEPFAKNGPRPFSGAVFGEGLTRIVYGLVKKLVIVDIVLARTPKAGYDFHVWAPLTLQDVIRHGSALEAWQFVANRFLVGYLDFSAYSDIAIGASLLFGYRILENFDYPILATSIVDFWRRWHISLSGWCQRYVYMPVVGKTRNPYVSIVATMTAIGLWHAGTVNMLVWSLVHAALLCGYQTWGRIRRRRRWKLEHPAVSVFGWAFTMGAVVAATSFAVTNDHGLRAGVRLFAKLFGVDAAMRG